MKKRFFFVALMMVMTVCAKASNSWPTTVGKFPTESWPVVGSQTMAKFPKHPKLPLKSEAAVLLYPVEPVNSWPAS